MRHVPSKTSVFILVISIIQSLFLLYSIKNVVFEPGYVAQILDHTTPPFPAQLQNYADLSDTVWIANQDMGRSSSPYGLEFPFDKLFRSKLSFLGQAFDKVLYPFLVLLGSVGFCLLFRDVGLSLTASAYALFLINFNPGAFSDIINGYYLLSQFSLSLMPWLFLVYRRLLAREERTAVPLYVLLAGTLLWLATSGWSVNFFVYYGMFILYGIISLQAMPTTRNLRLTFAILATSFVFHLPWILPLTLDFAANASFKTLSLHSVIEHYSGIFLSYQSTVPESLIGFNSMGVGTAFIFQFARNLGVWKVAAALLVAFSCFAAFWPNRLKRTVLLPFCCTLFVIAVCLFQGKNNPLTLFFYEGVLRKAISVYALMARHMRWYPFFALGLGGMFAFSLQAVWQRCRHPAAKVACHGLGVALVLLYCQNWWNQDLTRPKIDSIDSMALMSTTPLAAEGIIADLLTADPADYRITTYPSTNDLFDNYVTRPGSFLFLRNYDLLGKDSFLGNYSNNNILAALTTYGLNTGWFSDHEVSRVLALAAVRQLVVSADSGAIFSRFSFGWMPGRAYGQDRVFKTFDTVRAQLLGQQSLPIERRLQELLVLGNRDFLPRLRTISGVLLSSEEKTRLLPLACSGALTEQAVAFAPDLRPGDLQRLQPYLRGVSDGSSPIGFTSLFGIDFEQSRLAFTVTPVPREALAGPVLAAKQFLDFFSQMLFPQGVLAIPGSRITYQAPPLGTRLLVSVHAFDVVPNLQWLDTGLTINAWGEAGADNTVWFDLGPAAATPAPLEVVSGTGIITGVFAVAQGPFQDALAQAQFPLPRLPVRPTRSLALRSDNAHLATRQALLVSQGHPADGVAHLTFRLPPDPQPGFAQVQLALGLSRLLEGVSSATLFDTDQGTTLDTWQQRLSANEAANAFLRIPPGYNSRLVTVRLHNAQPTQKPWEGTVAPTLYYANPVSFPDSVQVQGVPDERERSTLDFVRHNPALYILNWQGSQPAVVLFSETFDSGWVLAQPWEGRLIAPVKANGVAMLFPDVQPGWHVLVYRPYLLRLVGYGVIGLALLAFGWNFLRRRGTRNSNPSSPNAATSPVSGSHDATKI